MNVVIYARYSSDRQTEQSIEGQLNECYDFAKRNGYTIIGKYIDRAISGMTDHRPEFQRMIEDSSKKFFDVVLVYQLDRFARSRHDSAIYKGKLKKNGVRVVSARENISEDASGIVLEAVLEGIAEYYSVEFAQKVQRGMEINAEQGYVTGGNIALGYKTEAVQTSKGLKKVLLSMTRLLLLLDGFLRCMLMKTKRWLKYANISTNKVLKPQGMLFLIKILYDSCFKTSGTLAFILSEIRNIQTVSRG